MSKRQTALATVLWLLSGSSTMAQGRTDYMNVESPQVHPLEVVAVAGQDFIVACNTRNSTIEIFDTDETQPERLLHVVPVGLEPVSVRYHAGLQRLYTANFLGDSISVIALSAPAGTLVAELERTVHVGDEPLDIAFHAMPGPGDAIETLFVTHMSADGIGWRDARSFAPIAGNDLVPALVGVPFETSDPPDGIPDEYVELAAKEPYSVAVHNGTLFVLALKGGPDSLDSLDFDLDYYCDDLATPFQNPRHVGNLGTTGFSMAFDDDGTLYIVGADALNEELRDEPNVRDAATGFVRSVFLMIRNPCSDNPIVSERDVNLRAFGVQAEPPIARNAVPLAGSAPLSAGLLNPTLVTAPVSKGQSLSMLTDIALYDDGGALPKLYFTAFGNDRIGIIEPDPSASNPVQWKLRRIDIPTINGNPLAGPNGLAVRIAGTHAPVDLGDRVYVLNHLDGSITTIDPSIEQIVQGSELSLSHDPRPQYLTLGQRFLYDSKLSGNGKDSCASCHIHARTDGLAWDLGDPSQPDVEIPPLLPEGIDDTHFAADKNDMVTQSLQGLLNFELAPGDQFWVTNAPYHWRGDRNSFVDFNGAFESLLGGSQLEPLEMKQYEEFVNTIHYPPNPRQQRSRLPSGEFGAGLDIGTDGSSGAFRGMKIYHTSATVGQRGCATGCHVGFEGSDNRQTESGLGPQGTAGNPIEVAALRGLFQKESKRDVDGSSDPEFSPYTGLDGLFHTGLIANSGTLPEFDRLREFNLVASINAFNKSFFSGPVCGALGEFCPDLQALNQFVHEFDWGVGPLVGCPVTATLDNVAELLPVGLPGGDVAAGCDVGCSDSPATLTCMQQQAELANSGIAVYASLGGNLRGYWYDASIGRFVEEPHTDQNYSLTELLSQIGSLKDRLIFQAVPLGDERRVAALGEPASSPSNGPEPTELRLMPMRPDTFHARVPELQGRWSDFDNSGLESIMVHTLRLYQWGLILDAASENGFGFGDSLHHDPARRFRISGEDIRHGASLVLGYFNGPNGPPDPQLGFDQGPLALITLPLYATGARDPANGDLPIWETAAEFEPLMYYALMLGGPFAPGVAAAYIDQKPFTFPLEDPVLDRPVPGQFNPLDWNWLYVFVLNADGNFGEGGWQRLTLE